MQPTPSHRSRWAARLAALALVLAAGCGVDTAGEPACTAPAEPDLAWLEANVFTPSCGTSRCHGDVASPRAGLSLVAPPGGTIHGQLIAPSIETAAMGMPRVTPGDCERSYLYRKVAGAQIAGTRQMPPEAPLCQAHIDAICAWIEAGALPGSRGTP